jgi:hypothetical protein
MLLTEAFCPASGKLWRGIIATGDTPDMTEKDKAP